MIKNLFLTVKVALRGLHHNRSSLRNQIKNLSINYLVNHHNSKLSYSRKSFINQFHILARCSAKPTQFAVCKKKCFRTPQSIWVWVPFVSKAQVRTAIMANQLSCPHANRYLLFRKDCYQEKQLYPLHATLWISWWNFRDRAKRNKRGT